MAETPAWRRSRYLARSGRRRRLRLLLRRSAKPPPPRDPRLDSDPMATFTWGRAPGTERHPPAHRRRRRRSAGRRLRGRRAAPGYEPGRFTEDVPTFPGRPRETAPRQLEEGGALLLSR